MIQKAQKLLEEALRFPPEVRAAIAGNLLGSLDQDVDEDAEMAWSAEISRRLKEIETGKARTVSWAQARKEILGRSDAS